MSDREPPQTFEHTRTTPAEWDGLSAFAQMVTADGSPSMGVEALIQQVDRLDNTTLDTNRYYAVGRTICGFAQRLAQPALRARATFDCAQALADNQRDEHAKKGTNGQEGLRLRDIDGSAMGAGVRPLLQSAINDLSQGEPLLFDVLTEVARWRLPPQPGALPYNTLPVSARTVAPIVTSAIAGRSTIEAAAFAGAAHVASRALGIKHVLDHLSRGNTFVLKPDYDPLLREIGDAATVRAIVTNPEVVKAAKGLTATRIDEFLFVAGDDYLQPNPLHGITLDRKNIPRRPPSAQHISASKDLVSRELPSMVIRNARLICPAQYVPGLVDMTMRMVPDILLEADSNIRAGI